MNHLGARALDHWRQWLAAPLAEIADPDSFFTQLGETAQAEITRRAETLADLKPQADGYLEETARLETARQMAETEVIREMILIDPADRQKLAELRQLA